MGNTFFKEEFNNLNSVVSSIINEKNTFKKPEYNTSLDNVCAKYTVVLESELKKHVKVELQDLKDSIYLIPHANHVYMPKTKESGLQKSTLCSLISNHYTKILKIILLIKYVYDLEHNGDRSMAGMTIRNIRLEKNKIMEITYCITDQYFTGDDKIDLRDLEGFSFFSENFLTGMQRERFFQNMKMLLERKKKEKTAEFLACGDTLIKGEEYKSFLRQPKGKCNPVVNERFNAFIKDKVVSGKTDYTVNVKPNNPVLHYKACAEKRIMLIDLKVKSSKEVVALYEKMQNDYVKNIDLVLKCLLEIVEHKGDGHYVLKKVDTESLNVIQKKLVQYIAKFYFQSLSNFHALMDKAKEVPHFTLGENDKIHANQSSR